MKKTICNFFSLLLIFLCLFGCYNFFAKKYNNYDVTQNNSDLVNYEIGTRIKFNASGNSKNFVKDLDGWGGQEPKYRCTVGSETVVKFNLANTKNFDLELQITAFGVYPPDDIEQKVSVFANGTNVANWSVRRLDTYFAEIPASLTQDGILVIKFVPEKPYTPIGDHRKLGMAVHEMTLTRNLGAQTKRKIGRWLKNIIVDSDKHINIFEEYDGKIDELEYY